MARDYGNLKNLGHFQQGNVTAIYLRGERQDLAELRIIKNLENATCALIIGVNDPRRNQNLDAPYFTAVSRDVVPHHVRTSGRTWLSVYDRETGEPLTGQVKREHDARIRREAFDIPEPDETEQRA